MKLPDAYCLCLRLSKSLDLKLKNELHLNNIMSLDEKEFFYHTSLLQFYSSCDFEEIFNAINNIILPRSYQLIEDILVWDMCKKNILNVAAEIYCPGIYAILMNYGHSSTIAEWSKLIANELIKTNIIDCQELITSYLYTNKSFNHVINFPNKALSGKVKAHTTLGFCAQLDSMNYCSKLFDISRGMTSDINHESLMLSKMNDFCMTYSADSRIILKFP